MKIKSLFKLFVLLFLSGCIGASSTGLFGTGVTVAIDPRSLGTQIDDSIMDKSLDARLISLNKSYLLDVKTKILDGRIFITGKVNAPEEKLKITFLLEILKPISELKDLSLGKSKLSLW